MKRGDVITVALSGDYGKPRPAVVIQSDTLLETESVLVCLITSKRQEASLYRLDVPGSEQTACANLRKSWPIRSWRRGARSAVRGLDG